MCDQYKQGWEDGHGGLSPQQNEEQYVVGYFDGLKEAVNKLNTSALPNGCLTPYRRGHKVPRWSQKGMI